MEAYIKYLRDERNKAENTLIAYSRDLKALKNYLAKRNGKSLEGCTESDAVAYVMELGNFSKSKATINRKISAIRAYYDYLIKQGIREDNPFTKIKTSKGDKRQIDFLTVEEVEKLLELPDESVKGLRDRALMEFLYGTGARVTELVRLKFEDINLRMNFATIKESNSESRIVPIGRCAHDALVRYIEEAYPSLKGGRPEPGDYVFTNQRGTCLTRQGIWKILKEYGAEIGIADRMTPQVLRDSFAVHILQNGGDLKTLQELMGFDDMSVGIAYLAVTDIHVREVFSKTHPRA